MSLNGKFLIKIQLQCLSCWRADDPHAIHICRVITGIVGGLNVSLADQVGQGQVTSTSHRHLPVDDPEPSAALRIVRDEVDHNVVATAGR